MAIGQGSKIEAQDYNNINTIIAPVIGRNFGGTASFGYDNATNGTYPSATAVAQFEKITAVQWNNLRSDISRCRGHQLGTDLLISTTAGALTVPNPSASFTATASGNILTVTAVASGTIQTGSVLSGSGIAAATYYILGQPTGTTGSTGTYTLNTILSIATAQTVISTKAIPITEADRAAYLAMANAASNGRIITPPASIPAARKTTANLVANQQRLPVANGQGWAGTIRQTITISFPEEVSGTSPGNGAHSTARAYFNSGSQLLFSAVFTPYLSNTQTKNVSWQTLCSNIGTIRFGYDAISDGGAASSSTATIQSASAGYINIPTTVGTGPSNTHLLYTRSITYSATGGDVGNYYPNNIKLYGRKVTVSGFDTFTFVFEFNDDAVADTPPLTVNPNDISYDEAVDGTLTTTIQSDYASSASYIIVTPPSANTSGIV